MAAKKTQRPKARKAQKLQPESAQPKRNAGATLTAKQQAFVDQYLIDFNATQAAIRAGYSAKTAEVQGSRLLSNAKVAAAVDAGKAKAAKKADVTVQEVIDELLLIAHSDLGDVFDFSGAEPTLRPANQIPASARKALSSIKIRRRVGEDGEESSEIEYKLWSKDAALEKLGRYLAMWKDWHEHTGPDGGAIPIQIVEVVRKNGTAKDFCEVKR